MSMELPEWIREGAHVAEQANGRYAFTTVKRITATLVVLNNGSRYKRDTMRKVGENGRYSRTWLRTADEAYNVLIKAVVQDAATAASGAAFRVRDFDVDATLELEQVRVAVVEAQAKLAELVAARAAIQNPEG